MKTVKHISDAWLLEMIFRGQGRRAIDSLTAMGFRGSVIIQKFEGYEAKSYIRFGSTLASSWITEAGEDRLVELVPSMWAMVETKREVWRKRA